MNERIKELWKIAGGSYSPGNQHDYPSARILNPEPFAELIIKECLLRCSDFDSRRKIKEYFGVE